MRKTHDILLETRAALPTLTASSERKNAALLAIAERLLSEQEEILAANREDLDASRDRYGEVMLDRLTLTPERIAGMAARSGGKGAPTCGASQRARDREDLRPPRCHRHHL